MVESMVEIGRIVLDWGHYKKGDIFHKEVKAWISIRPIG